MSEHQDAIADAMRRRVQDSALRAARLIAQHNQELLHCEELQTEYSNHLNQTISVPKGSTVLIIPIGYDGHGAPLYDWQEEDG